MDTTVGINELLTLTESMLGLEFSTDEEAAEFIADNEDTTKSVVAFTPVRVASAIAHPEIAAEQVSSLWTQYGYAVTRTNEAISGSIIVDAYTARGDILNCQLSPVCTVLSGETSSTNV